MVKVSVIVPVYNVAPYLEECLDSIMNQTLKEIEIICVDDCSTDTSYSILESYAKRDSRFIIIKNNINIGSGPSRNIGIRLAKGNTIIFIDSDDYIDIDYLNNLFINHKKYGKTITYSSSICIFDNVNFKDCTLVNNLEGISNFSIIDDRFDTIEHVSSCTVNKLYDRDFLLNNNIFFMDINSGADDEDFFNKVLLNNPTFAYTNKSIYYRRKRKNSLMYNSVFDLNIIINTIKLMENSIEYCLRNKPYYINSIYKRTFIIVYDRFYNTIHKDTFYSYLFDFVKNINISFDKDNILSYTDLHHKEYLLIKNNKTYKDYMISKLLQENITFRKEIHKLSININIIYNLIDNIINKLAWFIPVKKWRDRFRESIYKIDDLEK